MAREPVNAFVALGANLGDAPQTVRAACAALGDWPGVQLLRCSRFYRSAPIESSGPDYTNAVVEIRTTLSAPHLLIALQALENAAGRERPYHNAPRTLDLDLLLYGSGCIQSSSLTVPHPRMNMRAFVLLPLAEIAPQLVSAAQLQAVRDQALEALA